MKQKWAYVVLAVLALVFVLREVRYISSKSATYDEAYFVAMGWSTLKTGDYRLRKDKTFLVPFITSLPLVFSKLDFPIKENVHWQEAEKQRGSWAYSLDFLYKSNFSSEKILFLARLPVVIIGVCLMFFVFIWTKELSGSDTAGLAAAFLYSFSPDILAHSGLATEDLSIAAFSFVTLFYLWKYLKEPKIIYLILTALMLALALNIKHSALFLLPVIAAYYLINIKQVKMNSSQLATFFFFFLFPFLLIYSIVHIKEYLLSLKETIGYVNQSQMSFFMGKFSLKGFREYFLVSFLIKSPVSLLAIAVICLAGSLQPYLLPGGEKIQMRGMNLKTNFYLLMPVVVLITIASFTPMQIGHRHILAVYPFLFVFAGYNLSRLTKTKKYLIPVMCVLFLHYGYASVKIHPHYLAYFNESIGGPENGYKYLVDSNLDWGQDLKGLRNYIKKRNVTDTVLSYYGSGYAENAGFDFQDLFSFGLWGDKQHINSESPAKEVFALSATNLQGVYLGRIGHNMFDWIKNQKPDTKIGYSIFVYDITQNAYINERLANIYFYTGQQQAVLRQIKRCISISKDSLIGNLLSAFLFTNSNPAMAVKQFQLIMQKDKELSFLYDGIITNQASKEAYLYYFSRMGNICTQLRYKEGAGVCAAWVQRLQPAR